MIHEAVPFLGSGRVMHVADSTAHENFLLFRRPVQGNIPGVPFVTECGFKNSFADSQRHWQKATALNLGRGGAEVIQLKRSIMIIEPETYCFQRSSRNRNGWL